MTKSYQPAMAEIPMGTRAIPGPKTRIFLFPKLHSLIFSCEVQESCEDLGQSLSCVAGHAQS